MRKGRHLVGDKVTNTQHAGNLFFFWRETFLGGLVCRSLILPCWFERHKPCNWRAMSRLLPAFFPRLPLPIRGGRCLKLCRIIGTHWKTVVLSIHEDSLFHPLRRKKTCIDRGRHAINCQTQWLDALAPPGNRALISFLLNMPSARSVSLSHKVV